MDAVRILIVEDEIIVSESLSNYLSTEGYIVSGNVTSGEKALELIKQDEPDIIIMDIDLEGELDGVETTKLINKDFQIPVIYLTSYYDQLTLKRAKSTTPSSYLTKPFNNRDVKIAIEMAICNFTTKQKPKPNPEITVQEKLYSLDDRIFVKNLKNHFNKVQLEDVLWIEADGAYTLIQTLTKEHTIAVNLKAIADKINHPHLMRVHRSFIVNINHIGSFCGKESLLLDCCNCDESAPKEIPIGAAYKNELFTKVKLV